MNAHHHSNQHTYLTEHHQEPTSDSSANKLLVCQCITNRRMEEQLPVPAAVTANYQESVVFIFSLAHHDGMI